MKTYHRKYELLKDTPFYKAGWPLEWDGTRQRYFFPKPRLSVKLKGESEYSWKKGKPDIYLDYKGQSFSLEEVESMTDWFKPVGDPTPFIPPFPTKRDLPEYVNLYFENRLVDDVDVCRALSGLWEDDQFMDNLYSFVKDQYNKFYEDVL